ncbi:MAG TPA: histidine phosphatase family protein [Gemmatimonadota bacterium]|nr:histidine phosphatase family protein [Gemmatimonadota bacterium]
MALDAYVMRHGETEANVGQILMGRGDSPFTEAGRRHPVEVAQHLRDRTLSRIYVSPQARARRTAALVLETLGRPIPLETAAALAEIDAGEFEGLSFQQVRERVPRDAVLGGFRYPGGESWDEVQERAVEFLTSIESRHNNDAVLLVTHAGVIAGLVAGYLGEPIERYIRTRFNHDYLGRLTVSDGTLVGYEKVAGTVDSWY